MRYKEIIIGIVIASALLLLFVFRASIFHAPSPMPQVAPQERATRIQEKTIATISTISTTSMQTAPPTSIGVPVYHGRKLDEVRFDVEIEKLLSAQQKTKVSGDIHTYAKMVKDTPEYGAAWLQLALLKKAIGDYEGARDIWLYVTIARPHEATAFLNLGDLYTNYLKDYPQAEKNYQGAIKADPKVAMGYLGLSDLYTYFYKEKAAQAEAVLKGGIAANPNDVNLQKALSRLYEHNAK